MKIERGLENGLKGGFEGIEEGENGFGEDLEIGFVLRHYGECRERGARPWIAGSFGEALEWRRFG